MMQCCCTLASEFCLCKHSFPLVFPTWENTACTVKLLRPSWNALLFPKLQTSEINTDEVLIWADVKLSRENLGFLLAFVKSQDARCYCEVKHCCISGSCATSAYRITGKKCPGREISFSFIAVLLRVCVLPQYPPSLMFLPFNSCVSGMWSAVTFPNKSDFF